MLGTTNSFSEDWKQAHVYNYSHLILWFDGTDLINHSRTGTEWYAIPAGDQTKIYRGQSDPHSGYSLNGTPTYNKTAAGDNGIYFPRSYAFDFTNITFTIWAYRMTDTNYNNIFCIGNYQSPIFEWRFKEKTSNKGCIKIFLNPNQEFSWTNGQWKFIAGVIDGNTGLAYLNGTLFASAAKPSNFVSTYSRFKLLGTTCWDDNGGAGRCTDFRIYDYALSADEILEIFNRGIQRHK